MSLVLHWFSRRLMTLACCAISLRLFENFEFPAKSGGETLKAEYPFKS